MPYKLYAAVRIARNGWVSLPLMYGPEGGICPYAMRMPECDTLRAALRVFAFCLATILDYYNYRIGSMLYGPNMQ